MNKRRRYRIQEDPFCIQIELTESCNLACSFCGLQGIRDVKSSKKNFKFMSEETLRALLTEVKEAGWRSRLEFAMHGEPTMHPDYVGMIKVCREIIPRNQIMMTSNGGGILRKPGPVANIRTLFDVGLNILALDNYKGVGIVPKIIDAWRTYDDQVMGIKIYDYPKDKDGNPHQRRPYSTKMITIVADIEDSTKGTHATLTNHAGCGLPPLTEPMMKQCAKPFRELGIRWDGSVAMCCNDWRGVVKCGNVNETSIVDIWQGPAFGAAREKLFVGQRDFEPCKKCDYKTYRNGLLPDNSGKAKLHKPDSQTESDLQSAVAGSPYTAPVLRPWEK